jgi:putative oxidoreductase
MIARERAMSNPSAPSPMVDARVARYAVPVGRVLYALIFIVSGPSHFSSQTITYAAAAGVPLANFLVPAAGVLAMAGGLSVALGYRARFGALGLVAFLVPVTFAMHAFWAESEPTSRMMQQVQFMKNAGLLGAAILIGHFGAGPASFDARRAHSKTRSSESRE